MATSYRTWSPASRLIALSEKSATTRTSGGSCVAEEVDALAQSIALLGATCTRVSVGPDNEERRVRADRRAQAVRRARAAGHTARSAPRFAQADDERERRKGRRRTSCARR